MKTSRFRIGEHIELIWEGLPEFYVVRGHVPFEDARKAIEIDTTDPLGAGEWKHAYMRYVMAESEDHDYSLREFKKGRGAFAVTIFYCDE